LKHFFKYQRGYVNLDENFVYLTTTGNWSEINELSEKTGASKRDNNLRISLNGIFLIMAIGAGALILLFGLLNGRLSFMPMVLVPVGGYYLYRYMQRDLGVKYRIPISKITSIELNQAEKKVILRFLNGSDEKDQEILNNVEQKGFEILTGLEFL
jgi:hypothetical protein